MSRTMGDWIACRSGGTTTRLARDEALTDTAPSASRASRVVVPPLLQEDHAPASLRAVCKSTGLNRTLSPALSCPSCHRSASITVTGQTKPPRLGPSGPRMTGMSPVKSTAPMAYGLSWMFEGCSPASPPSARTHSGLGPIRRTPVRLELKCTSHSVAKKVSI
ncbi:hypothetical protein D3C84_525510 [compost metagenome]